MRKLSSPMDWRCRGMKQELITQPVSRFGTNNLFIRVCGRDLLRGQTSSRSSNVETPQGQPGDERHVGRAKPGKDPNLNFWLNESKCASVRGNDARLPVTERNEVQKSPHRSFASMRLPMQRRTPVMPSTEFSCTMEPSGQGEPGVWQVTYCTRPSGMALAPV